MPGRSGCLLALVLTVSAWMFAQGGPSARIAPRSPAEPPSAQVKAGRIIRPPGTPFVPPGVYDLPQLARAAGMIFSGTVTNIELRPATAGQATETVAVTFHVERAIRGATTGHDLTIRQWAGMWSSGQRYRLGEQVVLFLYPKSKLGLTSWVGGPLGHFAVDSAGRVLLTAQHLVAFRQDPVLGGKSRARLSDFALAVRQAAEEE